ncbi:MAG: response regulator [Nitrospirota bacterium]|nr:response regulator [Nitrospirota bacterium]
MTQKKKKHPSGPVYNGAGDPGNGIAGLRGPKQTEEQLKLLLKVVESAANSLLITDADGVIQWVNPAFCEITGYTTGEVVGRKPSILKSGKQDAAFYRSLWETIRSGKVWHGEIVNRRKDDTLYIEEMTITPVRDDAGQISHYIAVKQDITERKRIEKIKNEFISIVSHELRTPLTSIRGSLGLMTGGVAGELPPQAKRLAEIALRNSERLIRLVNDMLDVEKINAGKMSFSMHPHEIAPLVEHALEVNRSYGEQHGVEFVIEDRLGGKASVQVDSDRFEQVITNLLSNAAKFSPPQGKVTVSLGRLNGYVRVSIADRGQGIPEEFHGKIFDAFVQVDSSDTRGKGGSGLGLAISRTIVERLGGEISFESIPGEGSTFHVDLPEWRKSSLAGQVEKDFGKPRILICEDDRSVAAVINTMLKKGGFDTDISYNASQAKQLLAEQRYDALVLDLVMPYQDGISLVREIREDHQFHYLPVIVVSAKAEEGRDILGGSVLGVVDWIEKPIDFSRLIDSVKLATYGSVAGKVRILHVEDDMGIIDLTTDMLKDIAIVSVATTVREGFKRLEKGTFDLVILDLVLADGSGLELLPLLRAGSGKRVPVVIFTGYEIAEENMKDVAAVFYKGHTSAQDLVAAIRSLIKIESASGGEK